MCSGFGCYSVLLLLVIRMVWYFVCWLVFMLLRMLLIIYEFFSVRLCVVVVWCNRLLVGLW